VHELEPLVGDFTGSAAHVGKDDVHLGVGQDSKEDIQTGIGMDFDLLGVGEVVLEGADGFVFEIEVQRDERDLAGVVPVREGERDSGFANATFAAHGENHAFGGRVMMGSVTSVAMTRARTRCGHPSRSAPARISRGRGPRRVTASA